MKKPKLEIIEKDSKHSIYVLSQSIKGLDAYEKAKVVQKFLSTESKLLERVLESDLRDILRSVGINTQEPSESVLNKAFDTLKRKRMKLLVIDRNENVSYEKYLGISKNEMTLIEEDDVIDFAMEIKIMPIEEYLYEKLCRGCPKEKQCHDNCEYCSRYLEELDKEIEDGQDY